MVSVAARWTETRFSPGRCRVCLHPWLQAAFCLAEPLLFALLATGCQPVAVPSVTGGVLKQNLVPGLPLWVRVREQLARAVGTHVGAAVAGVATLLPRPSLSRPPPPRVLPLTLLPHMP